MRKRLSLRGRMVLTAVVAAGVALAVLLFLAGPSLDRRARGVAPDGDGTTRGSISSPADRDRLGDTDIDDIPSDDA